MSDTFRTTQVAIIGGGIMGVAAQFQLAENGWTDTILFEKAELTSGSTWHAAGQIAHAVGSRLMGWVNKTSIETYKRVEQETGQSIGWHEVGGVRIATTDDEVDWMKSIMGVGKLLDLPMELVGPEEVARINPFYKVEDVKAAVRTYADGHIDPSSVTMALAAATRARGAKIKRRNQVLGAARKGDMWLLHTEKGDVLAEHVVIAAGSYANQVGEWFGAEDPVGQLSAPLSGHGYCSRVRGSPGIAGHARQCLWRLYPSGAEIGPDRDLRRACMSHGLGNAGWCALGRSE